MPGSSEAFDVARRIWGRFRRHKGALLALLAPLTLLGVLSLWRTGATHRGPWMEEGPPPVASAPVVTVPPSLLAPEDETVTVERIEAALSDWRRAVLDRDADMVVRIEGIFLDAPARYVEALKKSASSDGNERVRAFSTRELGKFRRGDLASTLELLLRDESPFVRQNAAWALGELAVGAEAKVAARHAVGALRDIAKRDPEGDVRAAARGALDRLEIVP